MSILRVFKSTIPSINFVFGDGTVASFQSGRYFTDDAQKIASLEYEVSKNHPHIYIDSAETEVDSTMLDPIAALRARLREEILAEEAAKLSAAVDPNRDMGTSDQAPVKPANTLNVAAISAGGSGVQIAERVAKALKA